MTSKPIAASEIKAQIIKSNCSENDLTASLNEYGEWRYSHKDGRPY